MDLLLDLETHDLVIKNRDLALVRGADLVRQRLKQNLLTLQGEWFLDAGVGLPYFNEILTKATTQNRIKQLYIREILNTEGVEKLNSLSFTVDAKTRKGRLEFNVDSSEGIITEVLIV
jgi:hypothetical protein